MLRKECCDRIVLHLRVACVVHGKTEEFELLAGLLHQLSDCGLTVDDLLFHQLRCELVEIGMGVGVVSQIEALACPLLEYSGPGIDAERLNNLLDHKTGHWNMVGSERC